MRCIDASPERVDAFAPLLKSCSPDLLASTQGGNALTRFYHPTRNRGGHAASTQQHTASTRFLLHLFY
jgi:hypothetical protein